MTSHLVSYTLGPVHDNQINGSGLPCDGTVTITQDDTVCYANVVYVVNGTQYEQNIMNVPFQDSDRTDLYIQYFVNDQDKRMNGG